MYSLVENEMREHWKPRTEPLAMICLELLDWVADAALENRKLSLSLGDRRRAAYFASAYPATNPLEI
jgi:hypothetical protein